MITLDTVLHRVPELVIEVDTSNTLRLHHGGRVLKLAPSALTLLDVFHTPCTVREALQRSASRLRGERAMEDALASLAQLQAAGLLRQEPIVGFSDLLFPQGGYDAAFIHITILNDIVRKGAFVRAVREVVRPGAVVLDLGTGSGILGIAAAQAGARHVFAVEPAGRVNLAELVARSNGVADRMTFIRGWSTQITLPEPADVLTTDIVGNEALDMVILETVQDARRRLLAANAQLIPRRLTAYCALVDIPDSVVSRHRVDPSLLERWRQAYDIDFTPLMECDGRQLVGFYERPEVAGAWARLSDPVLLYDLDLAQDVARPVTATAKLTAHRSGRAGGFLVFFVADLSPGVRLSTAPWLGSESSHWYTAVWAERVPPRLLRGATVEVTYSYDGDGRSRLESRLQQ